MMKIKPILLILAVLTGASLALTSCGGDDNGADALVLDGLWEITKIEIITEEEEEENTTDLGYIRFGLTTYEYFTVQGETVSTISAGTYLLSDKTLTMTADGDIDLPVVAMIDLKSNKLTIEMTLDEQPQIWHAQKMADDPYKNEDGDEVGYVDFESEVHKLDSVPGSLWNPEIMEFSKPILDTLKYVEPYKAEHFYYLKVDTAKTYQLTVKIIKADYSQLPLDLMKYVQVWLSNSPYSNTYKAEDKRIEAAEDTNIEPAEGEDEIEFSNITSATGYLYIKLFSYQDKIEYQLMLVEQ